ncbi:MAG TPA: hypothetical protein VFM36_13075 [Thermoanaerobaculia bacterium]|nr:hypothetical protein [Thermoanaerobaculia bacterium]
MTPLTSLILPIVVSAVIVFIASAVIHMLPLWHKNDYPAMPNQDAVQNALSPLNIPPGDYMIPRAANMNDMKTPEFKARLDRGPIMIATVIPPGQMGMGRSLALWFVYLLVVSFFAAYIAGRALPPGASYLDVHRFAGATAFIGYSIALWHMWIWFHRSLKYTIMDTVDGLIYALLLGGTFGWLWP